MRRCQEVKRPYTGSQITLPMSNGLSYTPLRTYYSTVLTKQPVSAQRLENFKELGALLYSRSPLRYNLSQMNKVQTLTMTLGCKFQLPHTNEGF